MNLKYSITPLLGAALLSASVTGHGQQARSDSPSTKAESIWLAMHNEARREFGSPGLRWNDQLERDARGWAERLAREGRLRHQTKGARKGMGENLWIGTAGAFTPADMLKPMISEKMHFAAGTFPHVSRTGNWSDVGHYTQIIWPSTQEVGCATASTRQWDVLVCRYYPSGNFIGTPIAPRVLALGSDYAPN